MFRKYDSYLRSLTPAVFFVGSIGIITPVQAMEKEEQCNEALCRRALPTQTFVSEQVKFQIVQKELEFQIEVAQEKLRENKLCIDSLHKQPTEATEIRDVQWPKSKREYLVQLLKERRELEAQIEVNKKKLAESELRQEVSHAYNDAYTKLIEKHVVGATEQERDLQKQEVMKLYIIRLQKIGEFCEKISEELLDILTNIQKISKNRLAPFKEKIDLAHKNFANLAQSTLRLDNNNNFYVLVTPGTPSFDDQLALLAEPLYEAEKFSDEESNLLLALEEKKVITNFFFQGQVDWLLLSESDLDFLFSVQEVIDRSTLYNLIMQTADELPKIKSFQHIKDFYDRKNGI